MDAVRETHSYDPLFPFVWMHHMKGKPDPNVHFFHFHDWYEIVFVHEGEGTFLIDKHFYEMKKGDVYIIPGNIIHQATSSKTFPYICTVILFHPRLIHSLELGDSFSFLQLFEQQKETAEYRYQAEGAEWKKYEGLLEEINEEMLGTDSGNRHAVLLLLHRILLSMNRRQSAFLRQDPFRKPSKSERWMKEVLVYIDDHYMENELTLSIVAEQALVSPEHFSRVFKRVTGLTLPAYIGIKRLFKAKELLAHSNQPISYISDICGFKSVSYFHHKFREQFGCTPGEFRKKSQL